MSTLGDEPALALVVDDDPTFLALVGRWLQSEGYRTEEASSGETGLEALGRVVPEVVILDLHMPGMGGMEVLHRVTQRHPRLPVVVLTANQEVATVVEAVQAGAFDYLVKPIDRTKLLTTLKNAVERYRMSMRLTELERQAEGGGYPGIVGRSPGMVALFRQIDRVAASEITVLINGESGTGKELVARAIHRASERRSGPFVPVNCAAVPETLQESEFFGHERGAFTGAHTRRIGRVEQADRGSLFLDEVGELSPPLQAKLLRVLQERRFQRVGGTAEVDSDFRLLAATHRDLVEEVQAGRFREDLFFRIAVFEMELPPLRDRGGDVELLAARLLEDYLAQEGGKDKRLAPETAQLLRAYSWPGNVRELQNAIQRAVVVADGDTILPEHLPARIRSPGTGSSPLVATRAAPGNNDGDGGEGKGPSKAGNSTSEHTLEEIERRSIVEVLDQAGGNISEAVRRLGIGRSTLYRKLKKYGLR